MIRQWSNSPANIKRELEKGANKHPKRRQASGGTNTASRRSGLRQNYLWTAKLCHQDVEKQNKKRMQHFWLNRNNI